MPSRIETFVYPSPQTVHVHSEFTPHLEELKKLLFPLDRGTFDQVGHAAVGEVGIANLFKVCLCFSFVYVMYASAVSTILLTFVDLFEREGFGV